MISRLNLLFIIPLIAGCSVFGINTVEEALYDVLQVKDHFELRQYAPMVIAETYVEGDFEESGNQAFQQLFRYISGENISAREIAMTAPVIADRAEPAQGKKIAMTAPVLEERQGPGWRFMFVLPAVYSLDSAPTPLNDKVKLTREPQKRVAVLRFTGLMDEGVIKEKTEKLSGWIEINGLTPTSKPRWAGYNPPWTIPFLRRNEIMIEVL